MISKKNYEKPILIRIGNPLFTKHGASPQSVFPSRSKIEDHSVEELTEKYGSPLFVFSEKQIRTQFQRFKTAFDSRYPKVQYSWSYKTNYLKGICALFHREGAIAEVVSDFEYEKARALGIPGHDIIYNGPYKTHESLRRAVQEGARIHIDHVDEIGELEEISKELGIAAKVALRVNMNTGIFPQWTRFGLHLESGQAMKAIERLFHGKILKLEGLHTHVGTFILDPRAYEKAATQLGRFMLEIEARFEVKLNYLDLGGGFPSKHHLKVVYQPPEIAVPPIEDYAESITSALKATLGERDLPLLVLESGRHMIDEAGTLITSVVSQKLLPDGRRGYVLDAGVNLLYTSTWYKYRIELDGEERSIPEPSVLFGPLCMNIDVVDEAIMLPRLPRGKRMILSPVGAYNVTQWMQFIQYRPAVILLRENGKVDVLRRRENLNSVEMDEVLPSDLGLLNARQVVA